MAYFLQGIDNAIFNAVNGVKNIFSKKKSETAFYGNSGNNDFDTPVSSLPLYSLESFYNLIPIISSVAKSLKEISDTCVAQKLEVFNIRSDEAAEKYPEVIDSFIKHPSLNWARGEIIKLFITDLLIAGEAYAYRVNVDGIVQVQRLNPCNIEVEGSTLDHKYFYGTSNGRVELDEKHLVVLKYNPCHTDNLRGVGVIQENKELFKHARDMIISRNFRLINAPAIDGVFTQEESDTGVTGDDRIQKSIVAKYTGPTKAGVPMVLPGKLKFHDTSNSLGNLKINENLAILHREIMAIFGLPRFLQEIGTRDTGQKYNNHELQLQYYLSNTIKPLLEHLEAIFNTVLKITAPGYAVRFVLPKEIFTRLEIAKMVENGLITPNEARKLYGLPKSEDEAMDKIYLAQGRTTLEQLLTSSQEPTPSAVLPKEPKPEDNEPPEPPEKKPPEKVARGIVRVKSWRDEASGGWHSCPGDGVWTTNELKAGRNVTAIGRDLVRLGEASVNKKAKEQAKNYEKFLAESYTGILQALKKCESSWLGNGKAEGDWEDKLFDVAKNNASLGLVMDNANIAAGAAAFSNVGQTLTTEIPFGSAGRPEVAKRLNLLRKNSPLINNTTKEKLGAVLKSSVSDGLSTAETAQAIMRRFGADTWKTSPGFARIFKPGYVTHGRDWDSVMAEVLRTEKLMNRSLVIARTETGRAYTAFSKQAMIDSDVVSHIEMAGCSVEGELNSNKPCTEISATDNFVLLHPQCSAVCIACKFKGVV